MIDFHSHFLPGIDDGSKDTEESLAMLRESFGQGVSEIIATPHFYASLDTPQTWLKKRGKAFESLTRQLTREMPKIRLGAEVHYYEGMAGSVDIRKLRIDGTSLLLVEMPHGIWTPREASVITALSCRCGITVILAHIERYHPFQSMEVWERFRQNGILMQANAEFFIKRRTKKKALQMLKNGEIDLIGSDCHNMTERLPLLGAAAEIIEKGLGNAFLTSFIDAERRILKKAERDDPRNEQNGM